MPIIIVSTKKSKVRSEVHSLVEGSFRLSKHFTMPLEDMVYLGVHGTVTTVATMEC